MARSANAAFVPLNELYWCISTVLQTCEILPQTLDLDRSKFCWDVLSGIYSTWQLDHLSQQQMSVASVVPFSSSVTRHLHRLVKFYTIIWHGNFIDVSNVHAPNVVNVESKCRQLGIGSTLGNEKFCVGVFTLQKVINFFQGQFCSFLQILAQSIR